MVKQTMNQISFELGEPQDFSFLSKYGEVFYVFDQNDSGNISFAMKDGDRKYFIKVAGAKTANICIETQKAVDNLKYAIPLYDALKHPALIELVEHFSYKNLYIAVFKWAEGDCLFDHWNFDKYAMNPTLKSPYRKFKELPVENRLESIHTMFEFLLQVESRGYVAVDFYDGSIMYDFENNTTTICDIDYFRKNPTYNEIGEDFWGTKRLKAPEEYILGAPIDSVTNLFVLGALIFHFIGTYSEDDINLMYSNRSFFPCGVEKWELSEKAYHVVLKAVNPDRSKRYQSIAEFYGEWSKVI